MSVETKRRIAINFNEEDSAYLERFEDNLEMLCGMVTEMFEVDTRLLLSPVMRRLLVEKAELVGRLHGPLRYRLRVDNPGPPLKE